MRSLARTCLAALALMLGQHTLHAAEPAGPTVLPSQPRPIPPGPLAAVARALERPPGTPRFPYGRQARGTRAVYWQLRGCSPGQLDALLRAVHSQPVWLRQLTAELSAAGFDPHAAIVQAEGAKLLWQLVPYEYPPLAALARFGQADTTSTAFYDPRSGRISLSEKTARWPRAVSLVHEAMHAQQSEPGPVTWAMLQAEPWSARTWLYSAMRDRPRAMDAAVELGPSLASGLAILELYKRCNDHAPAVQARLALPSGRSLSLEWMLRQAHQHGIFGDTPLARELGALPMNVRGINELLGDVQVGRQFVSSLVGE